MPSTYSPSLRLELIGAGEQSGTWGTTTNTNLGTLLEQSIAGVQTITMLNADYTLTNYNGVSDEARKAVLVASGTNSAVRDIIAPLVAKVYTIKNSTIGGFAINIRAATGASVSIPNGSTTTVYCDGTDFVLALTSPIYAAGILTFLTTPSSANLATALTDETGTGLAVFNTAPTISSPTLTGTPVTPTASPGDNTTKIASTAFVQAALTLAVPPGTLIQWAGATAPTGYLTCPTTATNISRTTYAALFTAIGTLWGVGDGSTTFGLPYFATGQVGVQVGAGTVGTNTVGDVLAHTHTYSASNALGSALLSGGPDPTNATTNTGSTGGTANLAAGNRVMYCVKY